MNRKLLERIEFITVIYGRIVLLEELTACLCLYVSVDISINICGVFHFFYFFYILSFNEEQDCKQYDKKNAPTAKIPLKITPRTKLTKRVK